MYVVTPPLFLPRSIRALAIVFAFAFNLLDELFSSSESSQFGARLFQKQIHHRYVRVIAFYFDETTFITAVRVKNVLDKQQEK